MIDQLINFVRDRNGVAAVEFGLIASVLCFFVLACGYFGVALFQYVSLQQAIGIGARQLAISVSDATPYSDTVSAVETSAPGLTAASLTISVSINGSGCSTDSSCSSLMADGVTASVTGTYPCTLLVMGHDFLSGCELSSTATEMTE
jgi:Flp pilus assembly protein TadG